MSPVRCISRARAWMLLVAVVATAGCGSVDRDADAPATANTSTTSSPTFGSVDKPDANLADHPAAAAAKPSVVKVEADSVRCDVIRSNSGFVVAPNRVMTMAQSVAGAEAVSVEAEGTKYDARVVSYDPDTDVSILDVPNLPAPPLAFAKFDTASGGDALLLGYPDDKRRAFTATPARVNEVITLDGRNIYRTTTVSREVYIFTSPPQGGAGGGPLIDVNGQVLGLYFGSANNDPDINFAVAADELAAQMTKVGDGVPVATGDCLPN